jgi:hypothetical protein
MELIADNPFHGNYLTDNNSSIHLGIVLQDICGKPIGPSFTSAVYRCWLFRMTFEEITLWETMFKISNTISDSESRERHAA